MKDQVEQIVPRLVVGDGLIALLDQIDDPKVAEYLEKKIWSGIDCTNNIDHEVATIPINDLEREAVIDRLIAANVFRPPDDRIYDVDHDIAAEAYRVGRYDQRKYNDS